jgi:hypothetical protein
VTPPPFNYRRQTIDYSTLVSTATNDGNNNRFRRKNFQRNGHGVLWSAYCDEVVADAVPEFAFCDEDVEDDAFGDDDGPEVVNGEVTDGDGRPSVTTAPFKSGVTTGLCRKGQRRFARQVSSCTGRDGRKRIRLAIGSSFFLSRNHPLVENEIIP